MVKGIFQMEVAGRPKKSWRKCIDEKLYKMGIQAESAQNRREWKTLIKCLTPQRKNLT